MSTRRLPLQNIPAAAAKSAHAGLWLDKFITDQAKSKKDLRSAFVKEVAGIETPDSYKQFYQQWEKQLRSYRSGDCVMKFGTANTEYKLETGQTVKGRLVIGTGNESVLETALSLHRTYGVPYLPGSALKGLTASFARKYYGSSWHKDSEAYRLVFGNTDESGCLTFFDALPDANAGKLLHTDVLTPHHREYYQPGSSAPPADWDDPNPVPFLSVTGKFFVALAAPAGGDEWLERVFAMLSNALQEIGIGAKTSSGYGRMQLREK